MGLKSQCVVNAKSVRGNVCYDSALLSHGRRAVQGSVYMYSLSSTSNLNRQMRQFEEAAWLRQPDLANAISSVCRDRRDVRVWFANLPGSWGNLAKRNSWHFLVECTTASISNHCLYWDDNGGTKLESWCEWVQKYMTYVLSKHFSHRHWYLAGRCVQRTRKGGSFFVIPVRCIVHRVAQLISRSYVTPRVGIMSTEPIGKRLIFLNYCVSEGQTMSLLLVSRRLPPWKALAQSKQEIRKLHPVAVIESRERMIGRYL